MTDYYKYGALDQDVHPRLVADLPSIARRAGVPESAIYKPIDTKCTEAEIEWLKQVRQNKHDGVGGLLYTGKYVKIDDRMMYMAGALLRNFINAKVMTKHEVIISLKNGETPMNTMLFIPDFYIGENHGVAKWEIGNLLSMLITRRSQNLMTFMYVKSLQELRNDYGIDLARHLSAHYHKLGE